MDSLLYILMFLLAVLISSLAQILLKKKAMENNNGLAMYLNKGVILAYSMFLLSSIWAVWLYKHIRLSTGTLLDSSGYVYVVILSAIFLNEKITFKKILGIIFILSGILVCIF